MNIKVIQHADRSQGDLLAAASKVNRKYCQKHGYEYKHFLGNYTGIDSAKHKQAAYWNKIFLTCHELPSTDWLFYMDADIIIKDHEKQLETFIDMSLRDFLICGVNQATSREKHWNVNSGTYFIKNTKHMQEIIDGLIRILHEGLKAKRPIPNEQAIIQKMLKINYKGIEKNIDIFPSTAFNHDGKFLTHYLSDHYKTYEDRVAALEEGAKAFS